MPRRIADLLERWLKHPRLGVYLAILAVVLSLPALWVGWQLDDHTFRFGPNRLIPDRLTVVGVLPADFRPPFGDVDIWVPFVPNREDRPFRFPFLTVYARLDPRMPIGESLQVFRSSGLSSAPGRRRSSPLRRCLRRFPD